MKASIIVLFSYEASKKSAIQNHYLGLDFNNVEQSVKENINRIEKQYN
jgi:hypothetical protein